MKTTSLIPCQTSVQRINVVAVLPLVAAILFAGCAATHPQEFKGKTPQKLTRVERWQAAGWLKAYTAQAWESVNDEPPSYVHSDYKVLTPEGRMIMHVQNVGPMNEPETVRLDPGSYTVVAQARGKGTVRRSIIVETGQTTELHLD